MHPLKRLALFGSRWGGLSQIAPKLYRSKLQILCFHGFSLFDEHQFRPSLFMRREVFERRLTWLANHRFNVLCLEDGINRLYSGTLPERSVAITIDDGFHSVRKIAAPLLKRYGFPATVYVTSYYVSNPNPIFRLAVQYFVWKCGGDDSALLGLLPVADVPKHADQSNGESVMWRLIDYGERALDERGRFDLCRAVAKNLDADFESLLTTRALSLMTDDELRELVGNGIDVQLHTHRHSLPSDTRLAGREIEENRAVLEPIIGRTLRHFCYPGGIWDRSHWQVLKSLGIQSATTCEPGLNSSDTAPFALHRFLDRDDMTQLEFEIEMTGAKEFLRRARDRLSPWRRNGDDMCI